MYAKRSQSPRLRVTIIATVCALSVGASAARADEAGMQPTHIAPAMQARTGASLAQLERAFWQCDYAATVGGVDATPVALCSVITDDLKQQKFGGDFLEMLGWWRSNKSAEHGKLAARSAALDARR
jgi:hypothetical protein